MHENKLKLSHLSTLFVTRMNWSNVGGLSGMLLTLRDVGLPSCVVAGPPQLEKLLRAIKTYCGPLDGLNVEVHPYTDPVYKDETMTVHQVPIFSNGSGKESSAQPLDLSPSAEAGGRGDGRTSTDQRRTADRGPPCVISFVCKVHDKKGHFLVAKAKEIGLPVGTREIGVLISELKSGNSVTYQGKEISPADVLSPDIPGPRFLVVECPTEDFITPMIENETLKRHQEGNSEGGVDLIVHMTPEHILHCSSYRNWMERFGPRTEHLILNESVSAIHNQSAYRIQSQLNLIHPRIFPTLPDLSRKKAAEKDVRGVRAECLLKYQLRPTREWQRDMVTSNNTPEFVKEAMTLPGFPDALKECRRLLEADIPQSAEEDPQYPVVVFLGTGSAVPMKSRNVSSTLVHVSPSLVLLLDCGEGTFGQLYRHYGDEVDDVLCQLSAVFVSHIHADHHTGLLRVLYERERALSSRGKPFSPVFLVGPTILMTWLNQFHDHCQDLLHNIRFIPSRSLIEGAEEECPKARSLVSSLLEKCQLDKFQTCHVRHCKNAFGCAVVHQSGWKLVFSGDTMPCDALIEMGKDATLLIHEATLEDGLEQDAIEKAHSTTSQAISVGRKMNAEYVMLNHFSQRYSKLPLMSDEFSRKVGISFDHMRIRWSDFKILPKLMGPIKALFADDLLELEEKREKRERNQQEAQNSAADSIGPAGSKRDLEVDGEGDSAKRMKAK
ncbi:zinc phosphodiesterase ELAC protein 2 isoform X2 [Rana temporaria]|nr:zinc phosphodiesterase ELAC protein 2 isoform X2 [Rana temporaria]